MLLHTFAQYSQPIQCKLRMSVTIQVLHHHTKQHTGLKTPLPWFAHDVRIMFPWFSSLVFSLQGCHKVMAWVQLMHFGCIQQSHGISGMATADVEHGHRGTRAPQKHVANGVSKQRLRSVKRMVIIGYPILYKWLHCHYWLYILLLWCHVIVDTIGYCTGAVNDVDSIDLNASMFEPRDSKGCLSESHEIQALRLHDCIINANPRLINPLADWVGKRLGTIFL